MRSTSWQEFAQEHYGGETFEQGPTVAVWDQVGTQRRSRGEVSFGGLVSWGCNHTAGHLKQVTTFLDRRGIEHVGGALDSFDITLPDDPYGEGANRLERLSHLEVFAESVYDQRKVP